MTHSQPTLATTIALLALAPPTTTSAQEITALTDDLCTACSIETTPDAVLGADGESVIGIAWDIQRLSDGRFTMAFQDVIYEFTIFSPDGSEFQRVGREGEGPGEYAFVFWVREHAGLLHVSSTGSGGASPCWTRTSRSSALFRCDAWTATAWTWPCCPTARWR